MGKSYCITLDLWEPTCGFFADDICGKLQGSNIFTVARRNVDGQELLYHSLKTTNQIWVLSELKISPGSQTLMVQCTCLHFFVIAQFLFV